MVRSETECPHPREYNYNGTQQLVESRWLHGLKTIIGQQCGYVAIQRERDWKRDERASGDVNRQLEGMRWVLGGRGSDQPQVLLTALGWRQGRKKRPQKVGDECRGGGRQRQEGSLPSTANAAGSCSGTAWRAPARAAHVVAAAPHSTSPFPEF